MNEHSFIKSVHRYLHPDVYSWKIHDTFTGGVPDAMYVGPNSLLFIEYKYVKKLPKKLTTNVRHTLSPLQAQWLDRINGPAKAALVVGVDNTAVILVNDFSANISTLSVLEEGISRQDVANWIYRETFEVKTSNSGRANDFLRQQRTSNRSKKSS